MAKWEVTIRSPGETHHQWCVQWQTPSMGAPALWYYDSYREAQEAAARLLRPAVPRVFNQRLPEEEVWW